MLEITLLHCHGYQAKIKLLFLFETPKIHSRLNKNQERYFEWLSISETIQITFLLERKYDCVKPNMFHIPMNLTC